MKKLRRLLKIYTEKELISFGNYILSKDRIAKDDFIWDSDLKNWKIK